MGGGGIPDDGTFKEPSSDLRGMSTLQWWSLRGLRVLHGGEDDDVHLEVSDRQMGCGKRRGW
jgi:hypothetical protein